MSSDGGESADQQVELLHPFYLDTEMSMAFAAALSGGVALEREEKETGQVESQSVKNLRGNIRLFGGLGIGGAAEHGDTESNLSESTLVRQHSEASVFIALYDELRRSGRIAENVDYQKVQVGQIVSIDMGPAVAPLRRVVDQILRLFDLISPDTLPTKQVDPEPLNRQQRRQLERQQSKGSSGEPTDENADADPENFRTLFAALLDDLDRSGMIDVVVNDEDGLSSILTLDKRFTSDQAVELLHTSQFRVIGKVTQVWTDDEEFVNLHRRSVVSLVPALSQTITWGMLMFLASVASGADPNDLEAAAREITGMGPADDEDTDPKDGSSTNDLMLGQEAVAALVPGVSGPAIQILPLAICT